MTSPQLLLPLRVPELGPSFGKLVTGTGRDEARLPLAGVRYLLVSDIIQLAGEARRLAAHNERQPALEALGSRAWLGAWEKAVSAIADRLVERIGDHLDAEARAVRMPSRLRRAVALDPSERRALSARLGSAGASLVPALEDVDKWARLAFAATARERAAMERWQEALRVAARRLEASWLALEEGVDREVDRWLAVADEVARWRRPWWPVVVVGVPVMAVVVWWGLMRGGVLPMPDWVGTLLELAGIR